MTDDVTPDQVFQEMPSYFQSEKAGSTKGNVQFDLSGDNGGKWWIKIATGQLDPTAAFMSGKLKIKGDMGLAMKFASLFRRPGT